MQAHLGALTLKWERKAYSCKRDDHDVCTKPYYGFTGFGLYCLLIGDEKKDLFSRMKK